jgi:hypothetical protein
MKRAATFKLNINVSIQFIQQPSASLEAAQKNTN